VSGGRSERRSQAANESDPQWMQRALRLARRGEGWVEPNPMVGCVLVRNGQVIGEGHHRRFGGPHAEVESLRACTANPRGAVAYVTLEPCCITGKTPPCTEALIEAGLRRVVVGTLDPNPAVDGEGVRRLRAAGITVEVGAMSEEAAELIAPFATRIKRKRPYIVAKWAQSLDGKLATSAGDSQWISGEAARRRVHCLRARVDAVLVGAGTVLADDPLLTARDVPLRRLAARVVLDARLRLPVTCRLVATAREVPTWVFTSKTSAASPKAARLAERGVRVTGFSAPAGKVSLAHCLTELWMRDVTNLLVEGGPTILTTFLEAGVVDEALLFTAPRLIGGTKAPSAWLGRGAARLDVAVTPRRVAVRRVGPDLLHHLWLSEPV